MYVSSAILASLAMSVGEPTRNPRDRAVSGERGVSQLLPWGSSLAPCSPYCLREMISVEIVQCRRSDGRVFIAQVGREGNRVQEHERACGRRGERAMLHADDGEARVDGPLPAADVSRSP